ncbi:MAG: DUF4832 domain-containing protein [Planctomycetota bacterium]
MKGIAASLLAALLAAGLVLGTSLARAGDGMKKVAFKSKITHVQPLAGLVLWTDNEHVATAPIQLEFAYMKYSDVVSKRGEYDWAPLEKVLDAVAKRGHQLIPRFAFVKPGEKTTVPAYIKALAGYEETKGESEKKVTWFPDWRHEELRRFTKEFNEKLAAKYDADPRLAYVETGFGLWAEWHIYDGPLELGRTFPDRAFQGEFLRHVTKVFEKTPVLISVDATDEETGPFVKDRSLLELSFGAFDDSLLQKEHATENMKKWQAIGRDRFLRAPAGGELSYASEHDQKHALDAKGPHGESFVQLAKKLGLTFAIANDQLAHQKAERVKEAGLACGHRFRVAAFEASPTASRVTIENTGVAPLHHDAWIAVNGVRASTSLRGLAPGTRRAFDVSKGGPPHKLSIASAKLVRGQEIELEADLP